MRFLAQCDYRQSALCGSRRRLCSHAVRAVWAQRRVRQRGRTRVCVWAAIQISCTARGWGKAPETAEISLILLLQLQWDAYCGRLLRHKRPRQSEPWTAGWQQRRGCSLLYLWADAPQVQPGRHRKDNAKREYVHRYVWNLPVDLIRGNHIGGLVVLGCRVAAHCVDI